MEKKPELRRTCPLPAQVGQILRRAPPEAPGTVAGLAPFIAGKRNFGFRAIHRVRERHLHIVAQIIAPCGRARPPRPAPSSAEKRIEDAPEIAEDVVKIAVYVGEVLRPPAAHAIDAGESELVVRLSFLRIGDDVVGLGSFLETLLGGVVARVLVGMVADRELAVCLLYIIQRGALVDAKYFVVVPFGQPLPDPAE